VHDTAQNPFQDVMVQRGMCSEGQAPHSVVSLGGAKGGATVALHGRGVGGQHAEAEAVAEAGADFPALEFKSRSAGESVKPGRGGAAGAAKQTRARAPPLHAVNDIRYMARDTNVIRRYMVCSRFPEDTVAPRRAAAPFKSSTAIAT
jgi:hypothetical protein